MRLAILTSVLIFASIIPGSSLGHGFAGKRFFPTTFMVDDPFISDEASLLPSYNKDQDGSGFDIDMGFSKRIFPKFGFELGETFTHTDNVDGTTSNGFHNLSTSIKWQFFTNDESETLASIGSEVEIGGTGSSEVGSDSFTSISPLNFYFGKGFGNLPDPLKFFRPLAVTGVLGFTFPSVSMSGTSFNPVTFNWGFTLQYSLMYLQQFVEDVGLPGPFNRMVFVAELPMTTQIDPGARGLTTGYFNPGIVWALKKMQFGITARVPINSQSSESVGVVGLIHFFIDDMFPNSIGRPIF